MGGVMGFRENLKSELEYSGMLVKELEAKSGVKKSSLDNYLNSREQLPTIDKAVKIAEALGVSVEYLFTGKDTSKNAVQCLNKASRHICQLTEQLEPQKREAVLDFVKWLLSNTNKNQIIPNKK